MVYCRPMKIQLDISDRVANVLDKLLVLRERGLDLDERALDLAETLHGLGPRLIIHSAKYPDGQRIEGEIKMVKMETEQSVNVRASAKDRRNRPARIQPGSARWESSDPAVAQVMQDPTDELAAKVISGGEEGEALITLKADGDPSGDVSDLIGTLSVVVSDTATAFELTADTPQDVTQIEPGGSGEVGGGTGETGGGGELPPPVEPVGGTEGGATPAG